MRASGPVDCELFNYFCAQNNRKLSSKKIYLIRHGQTDYNRQGIVQGSGVDTDLNDLGHRQAQAFFDRYKNVPFDKVYTSALKRSQQSIKGFLDLGIPHETFKGLNEINWGNKEGQKITPEEDIYYHFMLEEWRKGKTNLPIEGGESPDEVTARMVPVMDQIMSRDQEKNILICMHGRAMRILLCYLLKHPLSDMDNFEHSNLCLYLLNYEQGSFKAELLNDTSHLKGI